MMRTCKRCGGSFMGGVLPHGYCRDCAPQDHIERAMQSARDTQAAGTHYKEMNVQPWDVVDTWPLEQRIGFYRGNALKYIMRMGSKDESAQEIAKGKHYLEKLLEVLNERTAT